MKENAMQAARDSGFSEKFDTASWPEIARRAASSSGDTTKFFLVGNTPLTTRHLLVNGLSKLNEGRKFCPRYLKLWPNLTVRSGGFFVTARGESLGRAFGR